MLLLIHSIKLLHTHSGNNSFANHNCSGNCFEKNDNSDLAKYSVTIFSSVVLLSINNFCLSQVTADSTSKDSVLLKQIEEQMKTTPPQVTQQTRSGLSFNPDIGVIGDFRGSYISRGTRNLDFYLNETELSLQAAVDPYARADFFLSFARNPETGEYGVEVEEGYL